METTDERGTTLMKKRLGLSVCVCVPLWLLAGCASENRGPTTRPSSVRDRQEAALQDPFGYSPDMDSPENDISGGKLGEFNRGAMRKDIDHVLNP
jgi:hypothetical protein